MTCDYPDLGSTSDWSCRERNLLQPIIIATQIWAVTPHQYGISTNVPHTSFRGETSRSVAKCSRFSQAIIARLAGKRTWPVESWKNAITW